MSFFHSMPNIPEGLGGNLKKFFLDHRYELFAAAFVLLEIILCALFLMKKGIYPEMGFLDDAEAMVRLHDFVPLAAYPPLIPVIFYILLTVFDLGTVNLLIFHGLGFAMAALCFYALLKQLPLSPAERLVTFVAAFANPYFVWLAFVSKDTAYEAVWLFLFFGIAYSLFKKESTELKTSDVVKYVIILTLVATLGFLTRLTIFFAAVVSCMLFLLTTKGQLRKVFLSTLACLCVTGLLYAGFNASRSGDFSLSTTLGLDVYYGNHPLYDYSHPRHDIDIFLPPGIESGESYSRENNDRQVRLALGFVKDNPTAFVARLVEKTIWHWLNFEKIPNLSTHTSLVSLQDNIMTLRITTIEYVSGLLYQLYKIIYIPAFIFALIVLVFERRILGRYAILLGPLLSLWPIVAITFPDTRFKITGELIAIPLIYVACKHGIQRLRIHKN